MLVTIFTLSGFILTSIHETPVDMANIGIALAYAQVQPVTCSVTNGGPGIAVGYGGSTDPLTVDLGLSFGQTDITPTNATANFGDGSTTVASITKTRLGDIQIEHTYEKSGNYSISITVYGSEYNPDNIPNIVHTQETCQVSVSEPVTSNPTGSPSITIKIDKTSYNYGEPVTVSGNITNAIPSGSGSTNNLFITIQGQGSTGQIGPIQINQNGSFSQPIHPTSFANGAGSYTVTAQYGSYYSPTLSFYYPAPPPPQVTMTTDKTTYNYGDPIIISGHVTNPIPGTPINIIIQGQNYQIPLLQVNVNPDGSFSEQVYATGTLWARAASDNTVIAQYGSHTITGPSFQFSGGNGQLSLPPNITMTTDKTSYNCGDSVTVSGNVTYSLLSSNQGGAVNQLYLTIYGLGNSKGVIGPIAINADGSFSQIIHSTSFANGAGNYTVTAQYGESGSTFSGPTFYYSCGTTQSAPSQQTQSTQQTATPQTTSSIPSTSGAEITVKTDMPYYIKSDRIIIYGNVSTYIPNILVTVIIRNPDNQSSIDQVPVGSNGEYSIAVTPTTSLWQPAGIYSVFVQYNSPAPATARTTFQFSGVNGQSITQSPVTPTTPTSSMPPASSQQNVPSSTSSSSTQNTVSSTPTTQSTSTPATPSTTTTTSTTPQQTSTQPATPQQATQQNTPTQQQIPTTLQEPKFPAWFNNVIIWYEQGKISNEDLFRAIQYLRHS